MYIYRIKLEQAEIGMKLAEPVYATTGMMAAPEGAVLSEKIINMMTRNKIKMLAISSEIVIEELEVEEEEETPIEVSKQPEIPKRVLDLQSKVRMVRPPSTAKMDLPPEELAPIQSIIDDKLKEEAVDSVKQLFNCFNSQEGVFNRTTAYQCVDGLERVVGDLVDVISADSTGLVHINDLKAFDEYTYHHSLSVSMLAMATGRELGLGNDVLFKLGRCAMLHDVGKQLIPLELLNKKSRLTDDEFKTIKNHSILGATNLKNNDIGDLELWQGILYHHEKVNGGGYPKGLQGDKIPLFSKIIAVADAYDAITSHRAYRNPMLPSEAFNMIRKEVGVAFDYDVVKAFFEKLELYPTNTIVELSDGRLGIVVDSDDALRRRLRPAVRIWGTSDIVYLAGFANLGLEIVDVLHIEDLPSGDAH